MTAAQPDYCHRLLHAARTLGVFPGAAQLESLLLYMAQMRRWNRTYNLTALRAPEQILVQHIFDSLAVARPITLKLPRQTQNAATIVDAGSGAGLPGVVLAAVAPEWQVHCVDAVEKKTAFVRQMSRVLGLPNLHAVHARVEALPAFDADVVVSRAFASLADFAGLAGKHVRDGGYLLAMKGHEPLEEAELLESKTDWRVLLIEPLTVPELDAARCLVWMVRR